MRIVTYINYRFSCFKYQEIGDLEVSEKNLFQVGCIEVISLNPEDCISQEFHNMCHPV